MRGTAIWKMGRGRKEKKALMNKKKLVKSMLKECTGMSILDSGGAYGRHWEENQKKNFDKEPAVLVYNNCGTADYIKNVYHFLMEELGNPLTELQKQFEDFAGSEKCEDKGWFGCLDAFLAQLDDWKLICTVNTYNDGGDLLSQVLQYTSGEWNGITVSEISVHTGCDVRGGYTKPVFFENFNEGWLENCHGSIVCEHCKTLWESVRGDAVFTVMQAGGNVKPVDIEIEMDTPLYGTVKGKATVRPLQDYPVVSEDDYDGEDDTIVETENGLICPVCKKGLLVGY